MSGFSPDWLALREPADHAARNADVAARLRAHFETAGMVRVVDLGCGAGSNLRATAPLLPSRQHWRLVDWDPALLAVARQRVAHWAGGSAPAGDAPLALARGELQLTLGTMQADLNADLDAVLAADPDADSGPDLVTAAALFDLVSVEWIEAFARTLAARRLPLYAVLTYDGTETWSPAHPLDATVLGAFHVHQGRDKGFGPAAGPRAAGALEAAFKRAGYTVWAGPSPWRLGRESATLVGELSTGIANAAAETGQVSAADAAAWAAARTGASATVGHVDLLALPA